MRDRSVTRLTSYLEDKGLSLKKSKKFDRRWGTLFTAVVKDEENRLY